jgi:hypothetical protein
MASAHQDCNHFMIGAVRTEQAGSAVSFVLNDARADFHRPHPDKAALRYRVKDARAFLIQAGISL